ncbi:hypothetical protein [Streptomyces griseoluteus]
METNQALATTGGTFATPTAQEMLDAGNAALRDAAAHTGDDATPPTPA